MLDNCDNFPSWQRLINVFCPVNCNLFAANFIITDIVRTWAAMCKQIINLHLDHIHNESLDGLSFIQIFRWWDLSKLGKKLTPGSFDFQTQFSNAWTMGMPSIDGKHVPSAWVLSKQQQ